MKTAVLNLYLFRTLNDVRQMTGKWLGEYNGERPFESPSHLAQQEYRMTKTNAGTS
ncbi:integrase core domain-containing protein [Erwinia amylovora]|uniref:integrase core domain-containing protein n=1 Tax=Erwinia amylovora TaxID=552 RepID=UPI003BF5EB8E